MLFRDLIACELGLPVVRLKNIICEQLFKAVFQAIFLSRC